MSKREERMEDERAQPDELVFECELAEPPEKVWRALTESELLAAWLMPNDFRAELGATFRLYPSAAGESVVHCRVLTLEPLRLLRYSWQERKRPADEQSPPRTEVTYALTPTPVGTLLRVVHSGFATSLRRALGTFDARATAALHQPSLRMAA